MPFSGSFLRYGIHRQRVFHAVVGKVHLSLPTENTISNGTGATEKHSRIPPYPWTTFYDKSNLSQSLWGRRGFSSSKHGDPQGLCSWEMRFSELKLYKEQHGNCLVPQRFTENQKLGNWVKQQRQFYHAQKAGKSNSLTPERISKLISIGFDWKPNDSAWDESFAELKLYKEKHGNCLVPNNFPENQKLGNWVKQQRQFYHAQKAGKSNSLTPERISKLEAISFDWGNPNGLAWDERFAQLKLYKEKHGNCLVPNNFPENKKLGNWVKQQRQFYHAQKGGKSNSLTPERISKLEAISFDWGKPNGLAWDEMFAQLKLYKEKHGNCLVPNNFPENQKLGNWVKQQRQFYHAQKGGKSNSLTPERISKLISIGFDWKPNGLAWDERFAELKLYKEKHGNCLVPNNFPENQKLGNWVKQLRQFYHAQKAGKSNSLTPERISKLEAISFDWGNPNGLAWDERFAQLKLYKEKHGNCLVPNNFPENQKLGNWVKQQRQFYHAQKGGKSNSLTPERISKLEAISFDWGKPNDLAWDEMFAQLKLYKEKHGNCLVPQRFTENQKLGNWVKQQRQFYHAQKAGKSNSLTPERISKLISIGFDWKPNDLAWDERFAELKLYKEKHGNCLVPNNFPENQKLGNWVKQQRQFYHAQKAGKSNSLTPERISKLEAISFDWGNPNGLAWDERFAQLKLYKEKHGNCLVPNNFPENQKLGNWVKQQRQFYHAQKGGKSNSLTPERISKLEAISFDWGKPNDLAWDEMFAQLKLYKEKHGNCLVPQRFTENQKLGNWVKQQRQFYHAQKGGKSNSLTPERISKLISIGFDWKPNDLAWDERFAELKLYKEKHGNCLVPNNFPENQKLGNWVKQQRQFYHAQKAGKSNSLTPERISKLISIGFDWKPNDLVWEQRYRELKDYVDFHGKGSIPAKSEDTQLYDWTREQRYQKRDGKLSRSRIDKLNELEFPWELEEWSRKPLTDLYSCWGDRCQPHASSTFRIMGLNINGILASNKRDRLRSLVNEHRPNILCLAETNVAWQNLPSDSHLDEFAKSFSPGSVVECAWYADYPHAKRYSQPGGVAIMIIEQGDSPVHVVKNGKDPRGLGRWVWVRVKGPSGRHLTVISAYRPVYNVLGESSNYNQHRHFFKSTPGYEAQICPRAQFNKDLASELKRLSTCGDICLFIDANDSVRNEKNEVVRILHEAGMEETSIARFGKNGPPTYHKGSAPIDGIFLTTSVPVKATGYLPFEDGLSDHRPLFVDIPAHVFIGLRSTESLVRSWLDSLFGWLYRLAGYPRPQ